MLDKIKTNDGRLLESIGGPPCYCGITSRRFGFDVSIVTKVGRDMPRELCDMLQKNHIKLSESMIVDSPTTKFLITWVDGSRDLRLNEKCKSLTVEDVQKTTADCWLVSPVLDEIPQDVFAEIKRNGGTRNFVMLDPQGYLRFVDHQGGVVLKDNLRIDLSGVNAIKVDNQEMAALTGGLVGLEGMQALNSLGIDFVLHTEDRTIHLLHDQTRYWLTLNNIDSSDSTGVGDILCAAFSCAYIKERDPVWAICFGAGAVKAALETRQVGIAKVPVMRDIEQNASYLYNTIRFEHLS